MNVTPHRPFETLPVRPFECILSCISEKERFQLATTNQRWHDVTRLVHWKEIVASTPRESRFERFVSCEFTTADCIAWSDFNKLYFRNKTTLQDDPTTISLVGRPECVGGASCDADAVVVYGSTTLAVIDKQKKKLLHEIDLKATLRSLPLTHLQQATNQNHNQCQRVLQVFGTEQVGQRLQMITNGGYLIIWDPHTGGITPPLLALPDGYKGCEVDEVKKLGNFLFLVGKRYSQRASSSDGFFVSSINLRTGDKRVVCHPPDANDFFGITVDPSSQTLVIITPSRIVKYRVDESGLKESSQLTLTDLSRPLNQCYPEFNLMNRMGLSANKTGVAFQYKLLPIGNVDLENSKRVAVWNSAKKDKVKEMLLADFADCYQHEDLILNTDLATNVIRIMHVPTGQLLGPIVGTANKPVENIFIADGTPESVIIHYCHNYKSLLKIYQKSRPKKQPTPSPNLGTRQVVPIQRRGFWALLQRIGDILRRFLCCCRRSS